MKVVYKYLYTSILKSFLSTLLGLILIFSFFQFLDELKQLNNSYTIDIAIRYVLLSIPSIANSLIILSLMIGVVFSIGRLNSDRELQIYHNGGISIENIITNIIKFSLIVSILLISMFEIISPSTWSLANKTKTEALGQVASLENESIWFKGINEYIFYQKSDNKSPLSIFKIDQNKLSEFVKAEDTKFLNQKLYLSNYKTYKIDLNHPRNKIKASYSSDAIEINLNSDQLKILEKDIKELTIYELIKILILSLENNVSFTEYFVEFISRIIKPITLIGMLLISTPFIFSSSRNISVGNRVFIALSIALGTHLLTKILSIISLKYVSMNILGPILPPLIIIVLGLVFIRLKMNLKYTNRHQ